MTHVSLRAEPASCSSPICEQHRGPIQTKQQPHVDIKATCSDCSAANDTNFDAERATSRGSLMVVYPTRDAARSAPRLPSGQPCTTLTHAGRRWRGRLRRCAAPMYPPDECAAAGGTPRCAPRPAQAPCAAVTHSLGLADARACCTLHAPRYISRSGWQVP